MLKILGIETSCDETAVAIVSENKDILFSKVMSQIQEHKKYGGVVPEVASRAHMNYLDHLLDEVIAEYPDLYNIDAIAVTAGPGLIGGVIVGVMYAKAIAAILNKPIIAVNHLEGHALTVRLTENNQVNYPFLLLLVSGGHTQFCIVNDVADHKKIGSTIDDALGEAFDKVAKMLGLGYPGGAIIEKMAQNGDPKAFTFPKPLCNGENSKNCDFSFSGLKTAIKRQIDILKQNNIASQIKPYKTLATVPIQLSEKSNDAPMFQDLSNQTTCDIAASFQYTVGEVLKIKAKNAITEFNKRCAHINSNLHKTFVLSGGVAANEYIRNTLSTLCAKYEFRFCVPPIEMCGDNAAMIAWVGIERYKKGLVDQLNFKPFAKGF